MQSKIPVPTGYVITNVLFSYYDNKRLMATTSDSLVIPSGKTVENAMVIMGVPNTTTGLHIDKYVKSSTAISLYNGNSPFSSGDHITLPVIWF